MNQFIGMAIQEMKADQKYSKVVGIKGGGGGVISMKMKEKLRGGGLYQWDQWISGTLNRVLAVKKSSIVGVYILIAIDFFGVHLLVYF